MICTSKEQETCGVEKMGCEGCYYDCMTKTQLAESFKAKIEEIIEESKEYDSLIDKREADILITGLLLMAEKLGIDSKILKDGKFDGYMDEAAKREEEWENLIDDIKVSAEILNGKEN